MSQEIKNIQLGMFVLTITRRFDNYKMSVPDVINNHYLIGVDTMALAEKAARDKMFEIFEPAYYYALLAWRDGGQ